MSGAGLYRPTQLPYTEPITDGFLRVTSTEDKQQADRQYEIMLNKIYFQNKIA